MANISCDCSVDSGCSPVVYDAQIRTARKVHNCVECDEPIQPGQQYEYVSALWEGSWGHMKTCYTCLLIRRHYMPGGWEFGTVAEDIRECLGFDYRTDPATWPEEDMAPEALPPEPEKAVFR